MKLAQQLNLLEQSFGKMTPIESQFLYQLHRSMLAGLSIHS
jgi:hypothetical protein